MLPALFHNCRIVKWDQIWCCDRVEMRFSDAMQICARMDYSEKFHRRRFIRRCGGVRRGSGRMAELDIDVKSTGQLCFHCCCDTVMLVSVHEKSNAKIKCTHNVCTCKCEQHQWNKPKSYHDRPMKIDGENRRKKKPFGFQKPKKLN